MTKPLNPTCVLRADESIHICYHAAACVQAIAVPTRRCLKLNRAISLALPKLNNRDLKLDMPTGLQRSIPHAINVVRITLP